MPKAKKKTELVASIPRVVLVKLVSGAEVIGKFVGIIPPGQVMIEDPLIMSYTYEDVFAENPNPRFLKYVPFSKYRRVPFNVSLIITHTEPQDVLIDKYNNAVHHLNMTEEDFRIELQKIREKTYENILEGLEAPPIANTSSWN